MHKRFITLLVVVAGLVLVAGSAFAVCPSCYWSNYWVYKGNVDALEGIDDDTGCNGSDVITFYLELAYDAGSDAEDDLWTAYQTCSSSAAQSGLSETLDAADNACQAKTVCQSYCPANPACEHAIDACRYYSDALPNAEGCVYESCDGTAAKWQSDTDGQTPYESPVQPDPIVCLSTDRCLYSTGASAARGTVNSSVWLCSAESIDGRSQGVWYQCESSRVSVTMEGKTCVYSGGSYSWQ
jgi:hypothetical protein